MKFRLAILLSIMTLCGTISAYRHTFKYTFNQDICNMSFTNNQQETYLLNNRHFIIKNSISQSFSNSSFNVSFVPNRGLRIVQTSGAPTFSIYTKTSDTTITASITLETKGSTTVFFNYPGNSNLSNQQTFPSGINTFTYTYSSTNTAGPKINITLGPTDTIYIKSIEITFGTTRQRKTISLTDGQSTISSFTTDSFSLPIQLPVIERDSDPYHVGWATSNNTTDYITSITDTASLSQNTELYPVYGHPHSTALPSIVKLGSSTSTNNKITYQHSFATPTYLKFVHFHFRNPSSGLKTSFSLQHDKGSISATDSISTVASHFFSLPCEGLLPVSSTLTLTSTINSSSTQTFTIDSVIIGYIPAHEVEMTNFTTPPSTPFHVHFREGDPVLTEDLTALDDISYSMTIDDSRYFFFSLPFDVPFSGISFTPVSGPFPKDYYSGYENNAYIGDWVISDYDEANNEWHDIEYDDLVRDGLLADKGYTIGLAKNNAKARVTFTSSRFDQGVTVSPEQSGTSLQTQYTSTNDPQHKGWNLLGNPYYTPLTTSFISAPYILIADNKSDKKNPYTLVSAYAEPATSDCTIPYVTEATIPPFASFFIQTPLSSVAITPQATNFPSALSDPIYHFNIVCTKPDSTKSVLTILSHNSFSEDYEIGSDFLSLAPNASITHEGLAIYASNVSIGDTITVKTSSSRATLTLGQNIFIPDNWGIRILPNRRGIVIYDNTLSGVEDVAEESEYDKFPVYIYTLDGRLVYKGMEYPSSLAPGLYIIRNASGNTRKIAIK